MRAIRLLIVRFFLACGGLVPAPIIPTTIGVHDGGITQITSDGTTLYTGGWDGLVRTWSTSGVAGDLFRLGGQVTTLQAIQGGAVGGDFVLQRYRAGAFSEVHDASAGDGLTSVAARGSRTLVTHDTEGVVLYDGDVMSWEARTRKWVYGAAFSPDGSQVAAWTWNCELFRWDASTGHKFEGDIDYLGGPIGRLLRHRRLCGGVGHPEA